VEWIRELAEQLSRPAARCSTHRSRAANHTRPRASSPFSSAARQRARGGRPALAVISRAILHSVRREAARLLKLINICLRRPGGRRWPKPDVDRAGGLDREMALGGLTNGAPAVRCQGAVERMPSDVRAQLSSFAHGEDLTTPCARNARPVSLSTVGRRWGVHARREAGLGDEDFSAVIEPMRAAARGLQAGD